MTDTPTDREAVKRLYAYVAVRTKHIGKSSELGDHIHGFGTCDGEIALYLSDIRAVLARVEAAEARAGAAKPIATAPSGQPGFLGLSDDGEGGFDGIEWLQGPQTSDGRWLCINSGNYTRFPAAYWVPLPFLTTDPADKGER